MIKYRAFEWISVICWVVLFSYGTALHMGVFDSDPKEDLIEVVK